MPASASVCRFLVAATHDSVVMVVASAQSSDGQHSKLSLIHI